MLVTDADVTRPLTDDEYGMLGWFAAEWPADLGPLLDAMRPGAEAQVFLHEPDGYTTVTVPFDQPVLELPSESPYRGEAQWEVDGMSGFAMLFSDPEGVMLEVIWNDGWPGRFPRPHELARGEAHRI